jgi:hypothetical protein
MSIFVCRARLSSGLAAAFVLALVAAMATPLVAQDWPRLRQGMWEITRTIQAPGGGAPKIIPVKKCMDPAAEWQTQNARLSKAGCTFSPVKHSGSIYTFSSNCSVMGVTSATTTTIVVESDSAYTMTVEGTTDGRPTKETAKAHRVGDCAS